MERNDAEKIIAEYIKPIFGFALKRCKTAEDAEDLSQDIVLKCFRSLVMKDDIADKAKYIWTVAHNCLSNYYRDSARSIVGLSVDEFSDILADPKSVSDDEDTDEALSKLRSEIAYLSKLQRKIVISYYFENQKQTEIAQKLGIPLGTVKWHLFEAKKELKRGMDNMRNVNELKFNPIKFSHYSINGSAGKKSLDEFLQSALAQNVCYCIKDEYRSVNEIADILGVSPVYVESELEHLEQYGLVTQKGDKYIVNFLIYEYNSEFLVAVDEMYKKAADIFANELYDALVSSGLLDDENIVCGQTDGEVSLTGAVKRDKNFILWSLIPYIAALSGESTVENKIKFEEVATLRPDGAHNIVHGEVLDENIDLPENLSHMNNWCGPMWNAIDGGSMLWQINCEWTDREIDLLTYHDMSCRTLTLFKNEFDGDLSESDYAFLAEQGYVKTYNKDGNYKASWQPVILWNDEINKKLLALGDEIKAKHKAEFDEIKKPYNSALFSLVSKHLRKICEYELQYHFHANGNFLLYCIITLLENGKLKLPTEGQRKALCTVILNK